MAENEFARDADNREREDIPEEHQRETDECESCGHWRIRHEYVNHSYGACRRGKCPCVKFCIN